MRATATNEDGVHGEWFEYNLPLDVNGEGYGARPWLEVVPFAEMVPLRVPAVMDKEGELRIPKLFRSFARGW